MTKKVYQLKAGTRTVWELIESEISNITKEQYTSITNDETLRFFRRLGGSEYALRGYTRVGYLITELISKNPNKNIKIVRSFNWCINPDGSKK